MQYTFVINRKAGSGRGARMGRLIARYLEQRAWRGHVLYLGSAEETRQVAKDHGSSANSCLIAVGGDGTVRQVAAGIIESGGVSSLGVLPGGGGNDFYRMTGMPTVATEALDALRHACPQRCDYGRVAWRQGESVRRMIFMNAAGVGLDAAVAGRAASLRLPGLLRYMVATIVELMRWRPAAAEIRFDSEPASRHMRLLFAYAANGKYGGGGFKLAPRASARHGMLDVCLVGNLSLSRALVLFPRAIQGTHESAPEVRIVRAALVELLPNTPMPLHVDGDLLTNRVPRYESRSSRAAYRYSWPHRERLHARRRQETGEWVKNIRTPYLGASIQLHFYTRSTWQNGFTSLTMSQSSASSL